MKRRIALILVLSVFLALYGLAAADAPPGAVARDAGFPRSPAVGQTAYGFTYYDDEGGGLEKRTFHGWCRPLEEGLTPYWKDLNGNGAADPDETSQWRYWAWYNAEVQCTYSPNLLETPGGLPRMSAREMLETRAKSWNLTEPVVLGDGAFIGGAPFCNLSVAHGPFLITVTVHGYLSPFTDIDGREPTSFPPMYVEGAALLAKGKAWRAERRNVAVGLARQVMAKLDEWMAKRLGGGPDFRGLYAPDLRPYILGAPEIPKGFVQTSSPGSDMKRPIRDGVSYGYTRYSGPGNKGEKESFNVSMGVFFYNGNENEASGEVPVADAHLRFENTRKELKGPVKLDLAGADEAVRAFYRHVGRNFEVVVFRRANVTVTVRGWGEAEKALKPTHAIPMAKKIMARLCAGVDQGSSPVAAGQPPPDLPDLQIESNGILLTAPRGALDFPHESAADRQTVGVTVVNASDIPAENVFLQLYAGGKDDQNPPAVGKQIATGAIPARGRKSVFTTWDLGGRNVENTRLWAKAYIPGTDDANPADNQSSVACSIWYAHNGSRAFSFRDDTYRFVNFTWKDRELEEMVEGVLATLAGAMQGEAPEDRAMSRVLFPVAYERIGSYLRKSVTLGAGGHCYGMSATGGLYFEDPTLKPVAKPVPDMSLEEASANINLYHRAQMAPLLKAVAGGRSFQQRDFTPRVCYDWVRNALAFSRLAPIIEFFGSVDKVENGKVVVDDKGAPVKVPLGHAVLAYKLVDVEGRDPVVYVYDPNYPVSAVPPSQPMPQITLLLGKATWANPAYMGYGWADASLISAHRVWREMPLDSVNAIVPQLKKLCYGLVAALSETKKMMAVVRCPVEPLFTDREGRRVGIVDGKVVNEIPGAEVDADSEVKIFRLPAGVRYAVTLTGTGSGAMAVDFITAESAEKGRVVSFQEIPVTQGSPFTTVVEPGGVRVVSGGGQTFAPAFTATLEPQKPKGAAPAER